MQQERHLAAIMFTDVVGYTAIMEEDESLAHDLLRLNRSIQIPLIEQYSGRFLKEMGDGILASFESAANAVLCAIAIQDRVYEESKFQLKIGIHIDDVVLTENDAFGSGVNIASRIEATAKPGTIVISEAVYHMIKNLTEIKTKFINEARFKNVAAPIKIYNVTNPESHSHASKKNVTKSSLTTRTRYILAAVILAIMLIFTFYFLSDGFSGKSLKGDNAEGYSSIAVLPFIDLSEDGDQEYLGDGLAEEILNVLAHVDNLKVISRTSSFSFKNKNIDLRDMGDQLDVETILEGSVRKADNKIRITAQLIETENGAHLWSETYDRTFEDLFAIQDDISKHIADKLQTTITLSQQTVAPTDNIYAYEQFLKGRYAIIRGVDGAREARNYFEEAVKIDPEFADAYAQLANAYWHLGFYGLEDQKIAFYKAKNAANSAIQVDPESYAGYSILSFINLTVDWDWQASLENHRAAVERGLPVPDPKHAYYKIALYSDPMEAVNDIKELLNSDPLSIGRMLDLSRINLFARRYEDVINNGVKTLRVSPGNPSITRQMADAHLFSGQMDSAFELHKGLVQKDSTYAPQGYIAALMALNKSDEAKLYYSNVKYLISPTKKAQCLIHLNQLDSAFHYLDIAFEQKDANMLFLKVEPHYDTVREDPRFLELLDKMNFPVIEAEL